MDRCETRPGALAASHRSCKIRAMQLYRATALIAVVLMVLLAAGYAGAELEPNLSATQPRDSSGQF